MRWWLVLVGVLAVGCASSTRFTTHGGAELEGEVVRGTPKAVFYAADAEGSQRQVVMLKRERVVERFGLGTFVLEDGARLHGEVVRVRDEGFDVLVPTRTEMIAREDIAAIEHPGFTAGVVGTVVTGVGLIGLGWGWALTSSFTSGGTPEAAGGGLALFLGGVTLTAVGIPIAAWGWSVWHRSRVLTEAAPDESQADLMGIGWRF